MLRMAMRELSLESLRVRIVTDNDELPKGLLAGAGADGIWLRHETLLDDGVVAASVALEEVAHYKVLTLGGRRDGLSTFGGALVGEFFATWFVWTQLRRVVEDAHERFVDGPIPPIAPSPELGYALGPVLGAAAAGVPAAQRRIERWRTVGTVDPSVLALATRLLRLTDDESSAPALAAKLARL